MSDIRNCPFCGGEAELTRERMPTGFITKVGRYKTKWRYMIWCRNDDCDMQPQTCYTNRKTWLIRTWNTRSTDALLKEAKEQLQLCRAMADAMGAVQQRWYGLSVEPVITRINAIVGG